MQSSPSPPVKQGAAFVFGSQALDFNKEAVDRLRLSLSKPEHKWILNVFENLPQQLDSISAVIKFGYSAENATQLRALQQWADTGTLSREYFPLSNTLLTPLVVTYQLVLYSEYVTVSDHGWIFDNKNFLQDKCQTLGLCTGLLSAAAISCSNNQIQFQENASTGIRLACVLGAVVDAENDSGKWDSFSLGWNSPTLKREIAEVLKSFPEAYVSVIPEEARMTVTTPSNTSSYLKKELRAKGLAVVEIALRGSFHNHRHASTVQSLLEFSDSNALFRFPDVAQIVIPMLSNITGEHVHSGNLTHEVINSILLEKSDWHRAFTTLHSTLDPDSKVVCFGPERCIPPWFGRQLGTRLVDVSDASCWAGQLPESSSKDNQTEYFPPEDAIAVIGMSCELPGASDLEGFWEILCAGKSQHTQAPSSRFNFRTMWREIDPKRTFYGNFLEDYDTFDHKFFKKSPREMASTDPQHRLMLQTAYKAVEQSGYFDSRLPDLHIGCYIGVGLVDYENNIACHPANAYSATGNLKAFTAGKISHYFGWTGPGLTIDTACSSSAVAIHQACRAIHAGECSAALAGGVNIMTSPEWFQNLAGASFLSPTGQCKPFDAEADGYCRAEGVGAVFLKKYSSAVEQGDQILGVVAASSVYQNQNCTPITVPNAQSLSGLFSGVLDRAKLKPNQVSVVEAHGTGTPVGDPAEYDGVLRALGGPQRDQVVSLGSVKGLIGHTESASGIVALIKTILMIHKGFIPPQASFKVLSPLIKAKTSDNIEINQSVKSWSGFRAALINNYGASGSNASLIVTQPPRRSESSLERITEKPSNDSTSCYPFWICAIDDRSLQQFCFKLVQLLRNATISDKTIANLSFQLARQSNRLHSTAYIFSCSSIQELQQNLEAFYNGQRKSLLTQSPTSPRPVILCFGGQYSKFVGLDRDVYDRVTILRTHLDDCDQVCRSIGLDSIYPDIFQREPISDAIKLQTALFALQYSCAQSWIGCGLKVSAVVGHSFGELTALCISGALPIKDTIRMIASRARIIQDFWGSEKGAMIAVEGDLTDVDRLLTASSKQNPGEIAPSIACYNSSRTFTVAGTEKSIGALRATAAQNGNNFETNIKIKKVDVTNAFHCSLVDPLIERLEACTEHLVFDTPKILLERAIADGEPTRLSQDFVASHMRKPVYFSNAVKRLALTFPGAVWLEAGSNSGITSMAARTVASMASSHFQPINITSNGSFQFLTDATVSLWKAGLNLQFWAHHSIQILDYTPILLPPYQFEKSRHWMDFKEPPQANQDPGILSEDSKQSEDLWTFLGHRDNHKRRALFRINASSDKYMKRVSAHIVAGSAPVCASTFQLVIAMDALFSLVPPSEKHTLSPELRVMTSHAPLCIDKSKMILLEVESVADDDMTWSWNIVSSVSQETSAATTLHVSGTIIFQKTDDLSYQNEFAKLERLASQQPYLNLLNGNDATERIQSPRTIYKAFSDIVEYKDDLYKGLEILAGTTSTSAGRVFKKHLGETWLDLGLADSFCQVAGIFLNTMTEKVDNEMYISDRIDQWIRSPHATIESQPHQWDIFACHYKSSKKEYMSDVFVFDGLTGRLIEVIIGIHYVLVSKMGLGKFLLSMTKGVKDSQPVPEVESLKALLPNGVHSETRRTIVSSPKGVSSSSGSEVHVSEKQVSGKSTIVPQIRELLCSLSGLEPDQVKPDSELADLGIDSLMGMELAREVDIMFKCTLEVSDLVELTDFRSLVACVEKTLGLTKDAEEADKYTLTNGNLLPVNVVTPHLNGNPDIDDIPLISTNASVNHVNGHMNKEFIHPHTNGTSRGRDLPTSAVLNAFSETKRATDRFIVENHLADYTSQVLPKSTELCTVHIVDAFEQLGCRIRTAEPGQSLDRIEYLKKHEMFVQFLYGILEQAGLVRIEGSNITRTTCLVSSKSAETLCQELVQDYPEHSYDQKLTFFTGSKLADCLTGKCDGLQLIFGSAEGREIVSGMYGKSPINVAWIEQIKYFLKRLFQQLTDVRHPIRILEMGSGTGGTTGQVVPLLAGLGVPFTYTITDLSPSLVAAARKRFKQYSFMEYRVLDIEATPPAELLYSHHLVLATNCVHATHDLSKSTKNIRDLLRPDGILLMLEMTELLPWIDLIFGLLEGWWLFEDGRSHALVPPQVWNSTMREAGFKHVDWTDGERPEAGIQRIIIGMASDSESVNTPPQLLRRQTTDFAPRQGLVDAFVDKYSHNFVSPLPSGPSELPIRDGQCILITGASGSLGSHLVAQFASLPTVTQVICVNRYSSMERNLRQKNALESRGLHLDSTASSKIFVIETDTSKPMLGMTLMQYETLVGSVTHIVHNAWPMSITRPISNFEAQFKVMGNLIELARVAHGEQHATISFQFISSIATVGCYPLRTGDALVPERRMMVDSVLPTGYGDAKLVCERMLDETLQKFPHAFRAMIVRIGQIAGSNTSGYWNPVEHLAFLIKSSQTINALPSFDGHLSWCSVNDVAASLYELLLGEHLPSPIYHIENPSRQPWSSMIHVLADTLAISRRNIVPFNEWLDRVRSFKGPADQNPAKALVYFLEENFVRMSCGGLILDTARARAHSATLRTVKAVNQEMVELYIRAWKRSGFLE